MVAPNESHEALNLRLIETNLGTLRMLAETKARMPDANLTDITSYTVGSIQTAFANATGDVSVQQTEAEQLIAKLK